MQAPAISLNSEQLDSALLQEVEVVQTLNDHWTCRLVLRDTPDRRPPVESFAGKPLRISTTDLLGVETIVFRGFVRRMRVIHEITGAWGAELDAVSATWKMAQGTRLRYYKQQTAQAVAQTVCQSASVPLAGAMPAGATLSYAQWDETDFQFVLRLADDVEAWLRPSVGDSDGVDVETSFQSGTTVNWREGEYGLLEWVARGRLRPVQAAGANYDPQVMRSSVSTGVSSSVPMFGDAAPRMVSAAQSASAPLQPALAGRNRSATLDDMQQRMQREARRGLANSVICTGISRNPAVRAGDTVTVTGLPEVDATYGVIRAVHRWTTNGYENEFTATPAQRWSPAERPAHPQMDGIYPARVVNNHDPHNQGRIQVQYYWQEENQTTWVRLLTPHAGASRGILLLPEIGEEVMIAFEEGDAERPYVVGSAWNGVHQPPATGFHLPDETNGSEFQKNDIKRLVTKSGHRLTIVDTPGLESISLATPTSNRILLTESHADTGNRPAIVLESQGDIVLASPTGRHHQQPMFRSAEVGHKATRPAQHAQTPKPKSQDDRVYDGALIGSGCKPVALKQGAKQHLSESQIQDAWKASYGASSPCCDKLRKEGKAPKKIVYINGIKTDLATQCKTLEAIAKLTCAQVIGVHNATAGPGKDILQTGLEDKAGITKEAVVGQTQSAAEKLGIAPTHIQPKTEPLPTSLDPASTSLSDVMIQSAQNKDDVLYMDHSQGGAVTSKAAFSATNYLQRAGQPSSFHVVDFAGAAQQWPNSVQGEHYLNMRDLTPQYTGLGGDPTDDAHKIGPGQTMYRFIGQPGSTNPQFLTAQQARDYMIQKHELPPVSPSAYHDIDTTYLDAYAAKHPDQVCR